MQALEPEMAGVAVVADLELAGAVDLQEQGAGLTGLLLHPDFKEPSALVELHPEQAVSRTPR
jgi:hypothetical protein